MPVTLHIFTSDPTGYEQVRVEVQVGDCIEYNRNGFRGRAYGVILGIEPFAKNALRVQPTDRHWSPIGQPVRRSTQGVCHCWRGGVLLGIPEPFEGKVLCFERPGTGANGQLGLLEIERALGKRNVAFNRHSPGWPSRELKVGEVVRCEMRTAPGLLMPTWFVAC